MDNIFRCRSSYYMKKISTKGEGGEKKKTPKKNQQQKYQNQRQSADNYPTLQQEDTSQNIRRNASSVDNQFLFQKLIRKRPIQTKEYAEKLQNEQSVSQNSYIYFCREENELEV